MRYQLSVHGLYDDFNDAVTPTKPSKRYNR